MSRSGLRKGLLLGLLLDLGTLPVYSVDPHLDRTLVPGGCVSCHKGHGELRSPMLPTAQKVVCLNCHDSRAALDRQVRLGNLSPSAQPPLLGAALAQPFVHPLSETAHSRFDAGAVTCTSCHSPHRRSTPLPGRTIEGTPRRSTRDPRKLEFETCETCHGGAGPLTQSPLDNSRLFDLGSRSYHPVHGPARDGSPSAIPGVRGKQISCTDCHGNSDSEGPRGVHGSRYSGLLVRNYVETDGADLGSGAFDLCFGCHDRTALLESSTFPLHKLHVVDERTSCATCHSAHGSIQNRALIRFGEESRIGAAAPSSRAGRLAFESEMAGSGACYVSCHGVDHSPATYGSAAPLGESLLGRPGGVHR